MKCIRIGGLVCVAITVLNCNPHETCASELSSGTVAESDTPQPAFVEIPAGDFQMGSHKGDWDEQPIHRVVISNHFSIATREVSNAEFERFRPEHRAFRGRNGTSSGDESPVTFVSWQDAQAYCQWLSDHEGKPFRLPTEAEWEMAARSRPELFHLTKPAVEDWCLDWYGPYPTTAQTNPEGYATGDLRVTRGGSYRSTNSIANATNRHADIPDDRNRVISFRLVEAPAPESTFLTARPVPRWAAHVSQAKHVWDPPVDMTKPYFAEPEPYIKLPPQTNGPLYEQHDHDPALTWCDNGDLLAIWYSTIREPGRELAVAASRLRSGSNRWDEADLFWDVPDRNDHAPALWNDGYGKLYHWNGLGVEGGIKELALIQRTSTDNGVTWSAPRIIQPDHGLRNQPISSPLRRADGAIVLPCDVAAKDGWGTALHISTDGGRTWHDPGRGRPVPHFEAGATGAWIAGIHGQITQRADGTLVAFGRGSNIEVNAHERLR